MNGRIREFDVLAVQAGEYVNSVYTPPVRSKTPGKIWEDGHIDWYTQFNQKFAELLITALSDKVSRMVTMDKGYIPQDPYSVGWNAAVEYASKELKRYYGVEE